MVVDTVLDDIVTTGELSRRPSRAPDYRAENQALVRLANDLTQSPDRVMQTLVDLALELCDAGSAGISLLEESGRHFRWEATAGEFKPLVGGMLPRDFSPCGTVLDRCATQLMTDPERFFPYIADIRPRVAEVLLVPFYRGESPIGTVWVVAHSPAKKFDAEDARLVTSLSVFAAMAVQAVRDLADLQKRAETALVFDRVLSSITDFAYTFDLDGRFTFINKPLLDLWGLTLEQAVGKNFHELQYPPDLATKLQQQIQQVIDTGQHVVGETPYTSASGRTGFYQYIFSPVHGPSGSVVAVAGSTRDYTALKQLEEQREHLLASERAARTEFERASHLKDEFLATLSHEIRTPLNAILGWSQIMQMSQDAADIAQGIEVIDRNARAQLKIIEDLLDMSRIISGKVRLDVQRLDIAIIVQTAVDGARPTAAVKGIHLQSTTDLGGIGTLNGDANRLQQVMWNLLSNAIKFTPKGGTIRVELRGRGNQVEINVTDSGEGIDPAFLPYVFDRFRQADASTTRRHGGLGLGLSIVKQLVELHGGTVGVTSPGIGLGTTFTISLPISAARPLSPGLSPALTPADQSAPILVSQVDLKGIRVLVVDDEADALMLIRRLLVDQDAEVETAGCVDDALHLLQARTFDVLVSDIGMPGDDGFSLVRRVRAMGNGRENIPAIALTAYARAEDKTKAMQAGFSSHLAKPLDPVRLISLVALAVGRS